jgi:hypothetical protein
MSAHQPVAAAARPGDHDAYGPLDAAAQEQPPTMSRLLAACAAASAVSTPPKAPTAPAESDRAEDSRDAA